MTKSKDAQKKIPVRIDFVIREGEIRDAKTGEFRFLLVPDPRVWEKHTLDGVEGYRSKLDSDFVSIHALVSMAKQMAGMSITYQPPDYQDKDEYLRRSKKRLDEDAKSK